MKFANRYGYTDIEPYEVIRVVSEKTIEVRSMHAERDPNWKPEIIPGGFAGHCINNHEQVWSITPDTEGRVVRIRFGKKGWKDKHGHTFKLASEPVKFYDYNF